MAILHLVVKIYGRCFINKYLKRILNSSLEARHSWAKGREIEKSKLRTSPQKTSVIAVNEVVFRGKFDIKKEIVFHPVLDVVYLLLGLFDEDSQKHEQWFWFIYFLISSGPKHWDGRRKYLFYFASHKDRKFSVSLAWCGNKPWAILPVFWLSLLTRLIVRLHFLLCVLDFARLV